PDIIVPMFTANYQSLYGVRDIVRLAQEARQKLDVDRLPLSILPVPTRFGTRVQFKESQEWLDRFSDALNEFYSDWLPLWIEPKQVLELIKIPQVDYFSFGEKLAVVEHGTSDPESMGFVYSKIAGLLASDLKDIDTFIGEQYHIQRREYEKQLHTFPKDKSLVHYEYDVYISSHYSDINNTWISEHFLPLFTTYLAEDIARQPKIFIDRIEIRAGDMWDLTIKNGLARSKILIAFITPQYFHSIWSVSELLTFIKRSEITGKNLVLPVKLWGSGHDLINNIQLADFSNYFVTTADFSKSRTYLDFQNKISELTKTVSDLLNNAPPLNLQWPVVSRDEVSHFIENQPIMNVPNFPSI
ncbi:MAG TPA: toll/interleukin-1 receptor domain-containing protein, partial [Saprospiraceae bacterium]|nr:toll/interleukin-1 receptor domain-containing protein [Saprospiraceae bacterium]